MPSCPRCSTEVSPNSRFCSSCGAEIDDRTVLHSRPGPGAGDIPSSLPGQGRFSAGTLVTDRYRIVGLLGRGGMGEVYRADDLKLGQSVALKFLPREMEEDPRRLALMLNEVKLARQVSHPNVCRVYDVGELNGVHFMAMEYVDGEDLASLIRRIGRLPQEKGVEIGRQVCAGLAAAHELGILHRDLKPANVMIDGRGRVKLTDFGLSALAERVDDDGARVGTPAYMSPEQLAGREATRQSDIYALGLLLYEIFTGRQAFHGESIADVARLQRQTSLSDASPMNEGLDETVERVVRRCLEMEPSSRPGSALAVAAALPGGDPLAAALAAGETPSPEMVAEAGASGGIRPLLAAAALVATVVAIAVTITLAPRLQLASQIPLPKSPDELQGDAVRVLAALGLEEPGPHRRRGIDAWGPSLEWRAASDSSARRWDPLASGEPPVARFWFRYSDRAMIPEDTHAFQVTADDPHLNAVGEGRVWLDPSGRLLGLERVVSAVGDSVARRGDPTPLFQAAGLDLARFREVDPLRGPPAPATEVRAWRGPVFGEIEGGVQAGWIGGRPTSFEVLGPWALAAESSAAGGQANQFGFFLFLGIMIATAVLVRRNLRAGRADLRGAGRVALIFVATIYLVWILSEVRLSTLTAGSLVGELLWGHVAGHAFIHAVVVGLMYLALEPYVRRLWPETLVSWNRLLVGRVRDPLVGKHVLFGITVASTMHALTLLVDVGLLSASSRPLPADAWSSFWTSYDGIRFAVARVVAILEENVSFPMIILVLLVVLRLLLRKNWLAILVFLALFAPLSLAQSTMFDGAVAWIRVADGLTSMLGVVVFLFVLLRMGLVAAISGAFTGALLAEGPFTWNLTDWYAGSMLVVLTAILGLAAWAFSVALGGRQLFGDSVME